MKRRILLLMMTALLSVGAWAQNLWTKTLWTGTEPQTVTESDPLTIAKSELQGARVGSQICIYLSLSGDAQDGYNINYYGSPWKTTWSGKGDNLVVSGYIDNDILSYDNPLNIYAQNNGSSTPTCTVTKVTLNYNGVHLFSDYSPNMWNPWGGVKDMKSYIAHASANDLLSFSFSAVASWGGSLLFTSGQGYPYDNPKTESTPTIYKDLGGVSTSSKTYIPLTDELLAYSSLFLSGQDYTASSVDLIYQPSAVNIGTTGYATFGYPFAVDLGELGDGQDAYTVTASGTTATLTSVKGMKIPANTGIILKGTNGDAISLPLTTASTNEIGTNNLHVSDGTVTGNGTIYVLANKNNVVGFYKLENGDKVPAGKAYLQISGGAASAPAFFGFGFGNGTTGIQTIDNGKLTNDNVYYDLQGRRVAQPTKGLYIVNGKKVIIK